MCLHSLLLLDQGKDYQVTVLPGARPDAFHIRMADSEALLRALQDDIAAEVAEKGEGDTSSDFLVPCGPCLVEDPDTKIWHRGQLGPASALFKVCQHHFKVVVVTSQIPLCFGIIPSTVRFSKPQGFNWPSVVHVLKAVGADSKTLIFFFRFCVWTRGPH
jgi:hypothetical protein